MIPYTDGKIMAKEQEIPVIGEYDVVVRRRRGRLRGGDGRG